MKIAYDPEQDIIRILFNNSPIDRSRPAMPGVIFDYDDKDSIVALELREASQRVHDPRIVEFTEQCLLHSSGERPALPAIRRKRG